MYKKDLQVGDLYRDEEIKIENKVATWTVIEVGEYITLESAELYWGRTFNFANWETSELRTWLKNNVTGTFQPQTVEINGNQIVELITIKELGYTGNRYETEFQKFYCRPIIKITNEGYVHNSAEVYNAVPYSFFPTISVPYDNPVNINGTVYGQRNIKVAFTNPAGSSTVTIKGYVKSTNFKLFEETVNGYKGYHIWNINEQQLLGINTFGMAVVLQITDHLGSIGTCEIELAKGDTTLGFSDIYNDRIEANENPTFTVTPTYAPQTTILHFIVNGSIEKQINNPSQTKTTLKMSDSTWSSLKDGVNTVQIKLIGQVQTKSSTITYTVIKKAPQLDITTDVGENIGRCINPPTIGITCRTNQTGIENRLEILIDDVLRRTETLTSNTHYNYTITQNDWSTLDYGKHVITLKLSVVSTVIEKKIEFVKGTGKLEVNTNPISTTKIAKDILIYCKVDLKPNATIKVYARNAANASFENCTNECLLGKKYTFKNTSGTIPYVQVKVVISDALNNYSKLSGIAYTWGE